MLSYLPELIIAAVGISLGTLPLWVSPLKAAIRTPKGVSFILIGQVGLAITALLCAILFMAYLYEAPANLDPPGANILIPEAALLAIYIAFPLTYLVSLIIAGLKLESHRWGVIALYGVLMLPLGMFWFEAGAFYIYLDKAGVI